MTLWMGTQELTVLLLCQNWSEMGKAPEAKAATHSDLSPRALSLQIQKAFMSRL